MSDAPNPYAVTTQEVGKPLLELNRPARAIRWMVIIALPLLLIGSAATVMDVGSIVVSGPIMFTHGLILTYLTRRPDQRGFRWFAWTCCVFPILVFLIIYLLQWSPTDAQIPISALCCVFTFVTFCGIFATLAWLADAVPLDLPDVALTSDIGDSISSPVAVYTAAPPSKAP